MNQWPKNSKWARKKGFNACNRRRDRRTHQVKICECAIVCITLTHFDVCIIPTLTAFLSTQWPMNPINKTILGRCIRIFKLFKCICFTTLLVSQRRSCWQKWTASSLSSSIAHFRFWQNIITQKHFRSRWLTWSNESKRILSQNRASKLKEKKVYCDQTEEHLHPLLELCHC